ncbi:MAG: hypothetical protein OEM28_00350 [Nitrosopumilus sp.]|nr:hypothetical protein [Nitrosopumilus sp.]MDH3487342.1 hypothetical protein [Nitrosopumilus sp.]
MTRWKKNQKEFSVKLTFDGANSTICRVPKPIIEFLGKPENLKFVIRGKGIVVTSD